MVGKPHKPVQEADGDHQHHRPGQIEHPVRAGGGGFQQHVFAITIDDEIDGFFVGVARLRPELPA